MLASFAPIYFTNQACRLESHGVLHIWPALNRGSSNATEFNGSLRCRATHDWKYEWNVEFDENRNLLTRIEPP